MSGVENIKETKDSSTEVKEFFNRYFTKTVSFDSNSVDAVIGFFKKRGFETQAAISTASVILNQAKKDNVNVLEVTDTLETLQDVEINRLVATILNTNRSKISSIGYKGQVTLENAEQRNIINLPTAETFAITDFKFDTTDVTIDNLLATFDKV